MYKRSKYINYALIIMAVVVLCAMCTYVNQVIYTRVNVNSINNMSRHIERNKFTDEEILEYCFLQYSNSQEYHKYNESELISSLSSENKYNVIIGCEYVRNNPRSWGNKYIQEKVIELCMHHSDERVRWFAFGTAMQVNNITFENTIIPYYANDAGRIGIAARKYLAAKCDATERGTQESIRDVQESIPPSSPTTPSPSSTTPSP